MAKASKVDKKLSKKKEENLLRRLKKKVQVKKAVLTIVLVKKAVLTMIPVTTVQAAPVMKVLIATAVMKRSRKEREF